MHQEYVAVRLTRVSPRLLGHYGCHFLPLATFAISSDGLREACLLAPPPSPHTQHMFGEIRPEREDSHVVKIDWSGESLVTRNDEYLR